MFQIFDMLLRFETKTL